MQKIVTLTINSTIDKSSSVKQVIAESKLRCKAPRHEPGGGGINVSRAIKILGGQSTAFYTAGGPYGQMLQSLLEQEELKHKPIPIKGLTRENLIILDESSGQQYRFGMPGPNLEEGEWRECLKIIATITPKPDYIIASGSLPPGVPEDFYAQLVNITNDINVRVIIDTSGNPLRLAACEGVYLLKPNIRELQDLASEEIKDEFQQEEAAKEIVKSGKSEVVVVSLGAAGALIVSKEGSKRLRSPTVPVKSRVGAGDSMVAGITLSLAKGKSLIEAVCFGVAAGTATAMTSGTELCRKNDTERLYKCLTS